MESIIKKVEDFVAMTSLIVPSSKPPHAFPVNAETPSPCQVEELLKYAVAMVLDSQDN